MLNRLNDGVFFFHNFLKKEYCQNYINRSILNYHRHGCQPDFKFRTIDISNEPIVENVRNFLMDVFPIELKCEQAEIQIWPINSYSDLHIHDDFGRNYTDFNSLIYLNDDFDGGEFHTKNITFKPQTGSLTFFNGRNNYHGVNRVLKNHRHSLIFWWKDTIIR